MEAAASGLPVIATDIRGCRQVVEDGVNGYLFPVGEVEALTMAITRVGEDEDLRERMARESVSRAAARFDERLVVDKVMGAYAAVAAARGLHPALVSRWGGKVY
jgi:glycosyltransferase involved in cell wall biosynthesis